MLVTTAVEGERVIFISWKEESSATAKSSGPISSSRANRFFPILPPRNTRLPLFSSSFAVSVVVVVFPSLPVTAVIGQGQSAKNSSISVVTCVPFARAATNSGRSGRTAGERNSRGSSIPWR